jgi:hypothetical protein
MVALAGESGTRVKEWVRDIRESGTWLPFAVVLLLGCVVGVLDLSQWDRDFSTNMLVELNAVVVELFIAGVVIAIFDYRRRRSREIKDNLRELFNLRLSARPEAVDRKAEIIESLAALGRRPTSLEYYVLEGARLNGVDLAEMGMRFVRMKGSKLVRASLIHSDLFNADFTDSYLVEADLAGASLYEAKFSGALVSRTNFAGADLNHADLRDVREMTCEQLTSAQNWQSAYRDRELACGAPIPAYKERSVGQKFREVFRRAGNPTYPFVLGTLIHEDGREETIVSDVEER